MLIGISGKLGSGKDTVATILDEIFEDIYAFKLRSFAYKLKHVTSYITGYSMEDCLTQEGKNIFMPEWGMTIGEFQQKMGTNAMRETVHKDGWSIALFADYKKEGNWIVTDVRFKNETEEIKSRDGYLIRVEGDPVGIRKNSTRDLTHKSETELDDYKDWDYIIENNGTLIDLHAAVNKMIKDLAL